jgi:hypothetical protein
MSGTAVILVPDISTCSTSETTENMPHADRGLEAPFNANRTVTLTVSLTPSRAADLLVTEQMSWREPVGIETTVTIPARSRFILGRSRLVASCPSFFPSYCDTHWDHHTQES